jgi:hypothetical protein
MIVLLGLLIAKDLDQVSGRSRGISRKYDSAANAELGVLGVIGVAFDPR